MRKTIALLLALVMCLTLCACGDKGSEEGSGDNIKLTDEMISKIESEIKDPNFENDVVLYEKLMFKGTEFSQKYSFKDFEATNQKQTSKTTYTVYGISTANDNYGDTVGLDTNVVFYCQEDPNEADGYAIKFYIDFPD